MSSVGSGSSASHLQQQNPRPIPISSSFAVYRLAYPHVAPYGQNRLALTK